MINFAANVFALTANLRIFATKLINNSFYMDFRKVMATAFVAACFAQNSYSVPAYPGIIKARQADGTEISIRLHGDEFAHFTTTEDGYIVVKNGATNNYEYAVLDNGKVKSCGIVAANADRRSVQAKAFLSSLNKEAVMDAAIKECSDLKSRFMSQGQKNQAKVMKASGNPQKILINNFPHMGEQHSLVILMEYNDRSFTVVDNPKEYYADALNKEGFTAENGANGSARDFYIASSNGMFKPYFDVVGPVKIDYSQNAAGDGTRYTDINMGTFVKAAVEAIDDQVDFSQYDHDGDGYVDNVYIYYAGYGAADSNHSNVIWPHSFSLVDWGIDLTTNDGVKIGSYTCSNEIDGLRPGYVTGIGTFVHEFGHCLGIPDLYDSSNVTRIYSPGEWDTMASGSYNNNSNTPPLFSAYERYELGWLEPEEITCLTAGDNVLPSLGESNKAYKISVPGNENEYFIFENRQQKGWDTYLPHHGMLAWHIDLDYNSWMNNAVNVTPTHQLIDIVEANGRYSGQPAYAAGVPFPGENEVDTYDFTSWEKNSVIQFDKIQENNGVVSFIVKGSDSGITTPDMTVSDIEYNSFKCSWKPVDGAEYYVFNVGKLNENGLSTPLADYKNLKLTDCSVEVDGLDELSEYEVSVKTVNGSFYTETNTQKVTTIDKPFEKYQVEGLVSKNISDNGFTASWSALRNAQSYIVNLSKHDYDGEVVSTSYDFSGKAKGLPEGWRTNATNYVSSEGNYGQTAPSLRFSLNRCYLIMTNGDSKISHLEFWMNGSSVTEGSTVEVDRYVDDVWDVVKEIPVAEDGGKVYSVDFKPTSTVRLYFNRKGTTSAYIDDVTVSGNSLKDTPLKNYENVNVGDNTSFDFSNLMSGTTYSLVVMGENNGVRTLESEPLIVATTGTSGISAVLDGNVSSSRMYDISGRRVMKGGMSSGIYIVKKNGKTTKVAR